MTTKTKRTVESPAERSKRERRETKIRLEAAAAAYERGKQHGRETLQRELRELLGVPNPDNEWL